MSGAPITFKPGFLAKHVEAYYRLATELDWVSVTKAREEYWTNSLNRPYTYGFGLGARTYQAQPDHEVIEAVRDALTPLVGFEYEGCFLNLYRTASNSLGWHADIDEGIDHSRPIAVVTVGAGRLIQFVEKPREGGKPDPGKAESLFLDPGSLLLMKPGMQRTHLHQIPKMGCAVEPRISLTFRSLK